MKHTPLYDTVPFPQQHKSSQLPHNNAFLLDTEAASVPEEASTVKEWYGPPRGGSEVYCFSDLTEENILVFIEIIRLKYLLIVILFPPTVVFIYVNFITFTLSLKPHPLKPDEIILSAASSSVARFLPNSHLFERVRLQLTVQNAHEPLRVLRLKV